MNEAGCCVLLVVRRSSGVVAPWSLPRCLGLVRQQVVDAHVLDHFAPLGSPSEVRIVYRSTPHEQELGEDKCANASVDHPRRLNNEARVGNERKADKPPES